MNKKKPVFSLSELHKPNSWILSLTNIPNSDLLCSGSFDGQLQFLKLDKEKRELDVVKNVQGVEGCVNALAFSNKRDCLVAAVGKEERLGRWHV